MKFPFNLMFLDGGAGAPDPSTTDTPPQPTPDPNPPEPTPKPGDTPPVDPPPADEAAIAAAKAAKAEANEKFYQRAYQELKATLQPKVPDPPAAPPPGKSADPDPDTGDEPTVGEMTKAELAEFMGGVVKTQMTAHENAALVKYQTGNAMKPINEYAAQQGLSQEDIQQAFNNVQAYGIDITVVDGPTKFAMAAMTELRNMALSKGHVAANSDAARLAAEKARELAATQQPGGGAPPTPAGEKSEEQKSLDRMNATKPKSSSSLLDKPGK